MHELVLLHQLLLVRCRREVRRVQRHHVRVGDHLRPAVRRHEARCDRRRGEGGRLRDAGPQARHRVARNQPRVMGVLACRAPRALAPASIDLLSFSPCATGWLTAVTAS